MKHITQRLLDHVQDELRNGGKLDNLASGLGFDADYLARLLGLPMLQPIPADEDAPFDLFEATERLDAVL
jgi:hypothetical protein